jgi:hypothetical protein
MLHISQTIKREMVNIFSGPLENDLSVLIGTGQLKRDGTRAEKRFRLSAKRTSPFKSTGASVQSTTGS